MIQPRNALDRELALRAIGRRRPAAVVVRVPVTSPASTTPRVDPSAMLSTISYCRSCKAMRAFDRIGEDASILRCPACLTTKTRL